MLSSHYPRIPQFTEKTFHRITTQIATRRSFPSQYRFCHGPFPSFPPALSQPISAIKFYLQSESCISRTRPFGRPSLRSYSTMTGLPTAPDDFDELLHEPSNSETFDSLSTLVYSSEEHSLQGDCSHPSSQQSPPSSYLRFDWRLRASSRLRKGKEREDDTETRKSPYRKRLQDVEPDQAGPFYQAFQDYKTRFVHLINIYFYFIFKII
jgi:hypothetical protein